MPEETSNSIPQRKKEHLELCLTDQVSFKAKTSGFERYEFLHMAITDVRLGEIDLKSEFYNKSVDLPFIISCMTGGTSEAENINAMLAAVAADLNIAIGVGSQRQLLENKSYLNSYKIIRKNARNVPILGNIGAAQVANGEIQPDRIKYLIDVIEADAFVIHINPLQELIQKHGEPDLRGLLKGIEKIVSQIQIPIIAKEVGAGIGKKSARRLLEAGVRGIDVAGAGGTSWSAVEILRNKDNKDQEFWDWGLPTTYCIRKVKKLKKSYKFMLIGSGGINTGLEAAKALALGADFTASARIILQQLNNSGPEGVSELILSWFETVKKIMFLTGSKTLKEFRKNKLIKKEEIY